MQNRSISHGYDAIDMEMVFDISINDIPLLLDRFESILEREM